MRNGLEIWNRLRPTDVRGAAVMRCGLALPLAAVLLSAAPLPTASNAPVYSAPRTADRAVIEAGRRMPAHGDAQQQRATGPDKAAAARDRPQVRVQIEDDFTSLGRYRLIPHPTKTSRQVGPLTSVAE